MLDLKEGVEEVLDAEEEVLAARRIAVGRRITIYVSHADKALAVWRNDAQIDAMYNSLFRELLTYMMEDPRNIGISTHLLFGAKNIERVGDHTTNIAETVHFLVRGFNIADDRPKDDQTSSTLISGS